MIPFPYTYYPVFERLILYVLKTFINAFLTERVETK